jgi:hypothetical protein
MTACAGFIQMRMAFDLQVDARRTSATILSPSLIQAIGDPIRLLVMMKGPESKTPPKRG